MNVEAMRAAYERIASESCCGTSSFVKRFAEVVPTLPDADLPECTRLILTMSDDQISDHWRRELEMAMSITELEKA